MDAAGARGFVTASYLLGLRGQELRAAVPEALQGDSCGRTTAQWVAALTTSQRDVRARWLASGLRELVDELDARSVVP
jgi:hypothetical protein